MIQPVTLARYHLDLAIQVLQQEPSTGKLQNRIEEVSVALWNIEVERKEK